MGSELEGYPEEGPPHYAAVDAFWMDETQVTNADFARFVAETGYVTVAERPLDPTEYSGVNPALLVPGSLVFRQTAGPVDFSDWRNWWSYVPGANWAHPRGPASTVAGRELHPVVHVAWEDVTTYAAWAGKELPSEAEWEFAARGGLEGAIYSWGDDPAPEGRILANVWIGEFPWRNLKPAKLQRTTPVRSYPKNGYGLYDMAGNVWEWTTDFYRDGHPDDAAHPCCAPSNPRVTSAEGSYEEGEGLARIPRRVIKGGSHLCSAERCLRYRPAGRQPQMIDSSMSHIGFRCISRTGPSSRHRA
jgi:formylglycine-generating enzyme required for sulfatase activity